MVNKVDSLVMSLVKIYCGDVVVTDPVIATVPVTVGMKLNTKLDEAPELIVPTVQVIVLDANAQPAGNAPVEVNPAGIFNTMDTPNAFPAQAELEIVAV